VENIDNNNYEYGKFKEGRDSSDSVPNCHELDGPGIESRWGEIFCTRPDPASGPPSLLYKGYRVFPGGKATRVWRRNLAPRLKKE